jgi:hypothetical protein
VPAETAAAAPASSEESTGADSGTQA